MGTSHWLRTASTCHPNQNNKKKREQFRRSPEHRTQRRQASQKTSAESEQTKQRADDEQAHRGASENIFNTLHGAPETQLARWQGFWPSIYYYLSPQSSFRNFDCSQGRADPGNRRKRGEISPAAIWRGNYWTSIKCEEDFSLSCLWLIQEMKTTYCTAGDSSL